MSSITEENRRDAYESRPSRRQNIILFILGDKEMTARQIAKAIGFTDLNQVKPRLTELMQAGVIDAIRKQRDPITGRNVSVYKRKDPLARV